MDGDGPHRSGVKEKDEVGRMKDEKTQENS